VRFPASPNDIAKRLSPHNITPISYWLIATPCSAPTINEFLRHLGSDEVPRELTQLQDVVADSATRRAACESKNLLSIGTRARRGVHEFFPHRLAR
jgi:hypothetical protein